MEGGGDFRASRNLNLKPTMLTIALSFVSFVVDEPDVGVGESIPPLQITMHNPQSTQQ